MHLLAVERMKLFTTRSPWVCALLAILLTVTVAALVVGGASESALPPTVASTQFGYPLGLVVVLALAALAVTTEYRTGTIQTTFQAVPKRTPALLAKAAVVAGFAFLIGEIAAFGSWGVSRLIAPNADLALDSTTDWTIVAGTGVVYALAAVAAVGVGLLIRHGAGALALVITYTLAVEQLVTLIPHAGNQIHRWLPFSVVTKFLSDTGQASGGRDGGNANVLSDSPLNPGWALAYFAAFALLVLAAGITTAKRRDA
jgi:ABC-2 type transport system permease protein